MSVNYAQSYTSRFVLKKLDKDSWLPSRTVGNIAELSIDRDGTDSIPLLETMSLVVDLDIGEEFESGWYQAIQIAEQGRSGIETEELCTFWAEHVSGTVTADRNEAKVDGRSVLYPASVNKLDMGTYVPKGVDGPSYCADLLRKSGPAPVETLGNFVVEDHHVFKEGTSVLEAVWTVLFAGGFCIQIRGDGTVQIMPFPSTPMLHLGVGRNKADLLSASYDYKKNLSEVPNVYIAKDGDQTVKAINDDPESKTSTVSRGFEHTTVDTSPIRINGETLQSYAERRLEEERTQVELIRTYTREYWPGVYPFSVVRWYESGGYPQDMSIRTQTLTIGRGITVKETAVIYVEG